MTLFQPKIIAPDSSHWAKWMDAVSAPDSGRRRRARVFHDRLLEQGRIPLLSWHHLQELLGIDDDATARARIQFIQSLPFVAYLALAKDDRVPGSIAQILAAEAIAASEGHCDPISIRDRARGLLLKIGTGAQAIGEESWIWETLRPIFLSEKPHTELVAALSSLRLYDENKTIGELSSHPMNSPDEIDLRFRQIHEHVFSQALRSTGGDAHQSRSIAGEFMARLAREIPSKRLTARELLVSTLVRRGIDESEIRDDCVLGDLSRLAVYRSQLQAVAEETGRSFDALKVVPMEILPSRIINDALTKHRQDRALRPGSDLIDSYLSVLAAYCSVLYVDKRTAEDFRRAHRKEPHLVELIGEIAKGPDFEALLATTTND